MLIIHEIHPAFIVAFIAIVVIMLVLDLGVFNKNPHVVSSKEALVWSIVWIGLAMLFSLAIWKWIDFEAFTEFQSAYWIEKALSVDNLFVFIMVFTYFKVDKQYHHKVLFWGIVSALVLRAIFIFAGVEMIKLTYLPASDFGGLFDEPKSINVLLFVFGIILLVAGVKSIFKKEENPDGEASNFDTNLGARMMKKIFRIVPRYDGANFFTIENGKRAGTTLLLVLGVIEFTDVIFAVDSIPAIFAITKDPFILYTSNIFAILGLRSLYFLLANYISMFRFLHYGLGFILVFIGGKMLLSPFFHVPSGISLMIVGGALVLATVASVVIKPKNKASH